MKIYAIASDSKSTPPTHACVFVHDDEGWAVTADGDDGVVLHNVADPKGVIEWFEDLNGGSTSIENQRVAGAWIDHQAPAVFASNPVVEVKPYGDRTWAVYLDGILLCVTLYRRGALAVQRVIEDLGQRPVIHAERSSDPIPFKGSTLG